MNLQVLRGASLVFSSLKFVSALQQGTMQPDIWRKTPLDMSQYSRLFGTARIPQTNRDVVMVADKPTHVVVLCRNQFYFFDALWPAGEVRPSTLTCLYTLVARHSTRAVLLWIGRP